MEVQRESLDITTRLKDISEYHDNQHKILTGWLFFSGWFFICAGIIMIVVEFSMVYTDHYEEIRNDLEIMSYFVSPFLTPNKFPES
jgi:hypothetical protein